MLKLEFVQSISGTRRWLFIRTQQSDCCTHVAIFHLGSDGIRHGRLGVPGTDGNTAIERRRPLRSARLRQRRQSFFHCQCHVMMLTTSLGIHQNKPGPVQNYQPAMNITQIRNNIAQRAWQMWSTSRSGRLGMCLMIRGWFGSHVAVGCEFGDCEETCETSVATNAVPVGCELVAELEVWKVEPEAGQPGVPTLSGALWGPEQGLFLRPCLWTVPSLLCSWRVAKTDNACVIIITINCNQQR